MTIIFNLALGSSKVKTILICLRRFGNHLLDPKAKFTTITLYNYYYDYDSESKQHRVNSRKRQLIQKFEFHTGYEIMHNFHCSNHSCIISNANSRDDETKSRSSNERCDDMKQNIKNMEKEDGEWAKKGKIHWKKKTNYRLYTSTKR